MRNESAEVSVGWIVLPGSPVGREGDFAAQSAHARVSIRIHDTTTAHDASCAFRGAMLMDMAMWLGPRGGEDGEGQQD